MSKLLFKKFIDCRFLPGPAPEVNPLADLFGQHAPAAPLEEPVEIKVRIAIPWPRQWPKELPAGGFVWRNSPPSLASPEQVVSGLIPAFLKDPRQIQGLQTVIQWSTRPGVSLKIYRSLCV